MGCEWNVNVYEKYPHYFVPFLVCLPHFCPAWPPVWPTFVPPGPLSGRCNSHRVSHEEMKLSGHVNTPAYWWGTSEVADSGPKWVKLTPNGRNPVHFLIRFHWIQNALKSDQKKSHLGPIYQAKCIEIWSEKKKDFGPHITAIWPTFGPNRTPLRLERENHCNIILIEKWQERSGKERESIKMQRNRIKNR